MRVNPNRYILAIIAVVVLSMTLSAQEATDTVQSLPGIEVETSVDRSEIYIGDLINYRVTIRYDSSFTLEPSPLGSNLGAFDVRDYQPDIISTLPDGRMQTENLFVLSTFIVGDYAIPPVPIVFMLPDGTRKVLLSEPVPIKVLSLLESDADSMDIRPSKAQFEFQRDLTKYYLWGGLITLLLIAGLIYLWFYLRKKKSSTAEVDLRPPWEIAFERLARLQQENLPASDKHKQYYLRLTEIVRQYLGRMYGLSVLDMTTEEFVAELNSIDFDEQRKTGLVSFLRHADLVKFAKHLPEKSQSEADFAFAHDLIESVRADFARREAAESTAVNRRGTSHES